MQIYKLAYSLLKCNCTAISFWYDLLWSFGGGGRREGEGEGEDWGVAFFLEPGLTRPMIYRKDIRTLPLLSFISALTNGFAGKRAETNMAARLAGWMRVTRQVGFCT